MTVRSDLSEVMYLLEAVGALNNETKLKEASAHWNLCKDLFEMCWCVDSHSTKCMLKKPACDYTPTTIPITW